MSDDLYIGLMSGTSADGVDAVLVQFIQHEPLRMRIIGHHSQSFSNDLRASIHSFRTSGSNELERLGHLDRQLGDIFAEVVNALLVQSGHDSADIRAIGSHGQTIRHQPTGTHPFTVQIGDPNTIAERTGITTVSDFRRRDVAAGGQGAPLVPAFHQALVSATQKNTAIINIGGIANITVLRSGDEPRGWDTGPGNNLMDGWIQRHKSARLDTDGAWAATGIINKTLLNTLLADDYFGRSAPKSTGPETFNLEWLDSFLSGEERPEDVQRTLIALTATTIAQALNAEGVEQSFVCGGGAFNALLTEELSQQLDGSLRSTQELGVHEQLMEAAAFAWLAAQRLASKPGNVPSATGASGLRILGAIYAP